jgi:hypothetical protein
MKNLLSNMLFDLALYGFFFVLFGVLANYIGWMKWIALSYYGISFLGIAVGTAIVFFKWITGKYKNG